MNEKSSLPTIVENIKKLMEEQNLNAYKLADFSDLPRTYVYNLLAMRSWKKGDPPHSPTVKTLDKIAKALGVKTKSLFE